MSTNNMPARIWADGKPTTYDPHGATAGIWDTHETYGDVSYVRAALVKEAMEALRKAQGFFADMTADNGALMVPEGADVNAFTGGYADATYEVRAALSKMKEAGL